MNETKFSDLPYFPIYPFLSGKPRNAWIDFPEYHLKVYVRKSERHIESMVFQPCLDIASIEVEEEFQGQGFFTKFLTDMEFVARNNNRWIYVENVLNDKLYEFLKKRGYHLILPYLGADEDPTPCFWYKP